MSFSENRALRVILVEDNPDDAEIIQMELRQAGFLLETCRVETEDDFLHALERQPDLILCDYSLPHFNARQALHLRGEKDVPLIVVSGSIGDEMATELFKSGATDYLLKDRLNRLGQAVSRALEQRQLRRKERRAQEALRQERDRLAHIAEAAPGAIFSFRVELNGSRSFPYFSPGLRKTLGLSPEELLGGPLVHSEDAERLRTTLATSAQNLTMWHCEYRLNHPRRGEIWLEVRCTPTQQSDGATLWDGFLTEVTERRRLEEEFRQAQKMEAFGQLAGGVAHDFNNLLCVINGFAELLIGDMAVDDERRALLEAIRDAGVRGASLTAQLLAFSRKTIVKPRLTDVNEVVERSVRLQRRLLGEDIILATVLEPRLSPVLVDAGQLEQVLMNLAVNARDAMPAGGRLTVSTFQTTVEAGDEWSSCQPGPHVAVAVSDTGCGLDESLQSKIFEPFFTTKAVGKGTGLGLATVYGIAHSYGGQIYVKSRPNEGATFTLLLPAVLSGDVADPEEPFGGAPTEMETLLLVEDEPDVRKYAQLALERQGYRVIAAEGGAEAIDVAEKHDRPIQLLITDVVMPFMGGRALADAMRARYPRLKVLYMSGFTEDAVVRNGVVDANEPFLQKPFTPTALASKVRHLLDSV